jgi:hypothetical protein
MDIWSIVAAFALRRNPDCASERRGGSALACASKLHKAGVDHAVREAAYPKCARPLKLVDQPAFDFCMTCPRGFEFDITPSHYWKHLRNRAVHAVCISRKQTLGPISVRYSVCLSSQAGTCVICGIGVGILEDFYLSLTAFWHAKECGGCMTSKPNICAACRDVHSLVKAVAFVSV